ncbi:c-type cytochrome [Luteolibacter marinus]|uniref:c-type cytochrome n=1 Tax=Luteolibacter marinus TaxID=2776705 RepID=UPI0018685E84|nr:cytochrome c [Luteolibacter marinus]
MKHLLIPVLAATVLSASADEAADKAKLIETGKANFATCMACHGPDGTGLPVGDKKMAPTLAGSKVVNGDPAVFALAVLKGIQKDPANTEILGVMAPLEAALDDEKLAGVLTYVRNSFGNSSSVVTPADAAKYRAQFKDIKAPVLRTDLEKTAAKK